MIYLIGGAPRTGKSTVAIELLRKHNVSFIPGDSLRRFLDREESIYTEEDYERLWRKTVLFCSSLSKFSGINWVIEGIFITPRRVNSLFQESPGSQQLFKAVFLGQDSLTPEEKFQSIRQREGVTNYTEQWSDNRVLEFAKEIIGRSLSIRLEAEQYGFRYFDTSINFDQTIDLVVQTLLNM